MQTTKQSRTSCGFDRIIGKRSDVLHDSYVFNARHIAAMSSHKIRKRTWKRSVPRATAGGTDLFQARRNTFQEVAFRYLVGFGVGAKRAPLASSKQILSARNAPDALCSTRMKFS